MTTLHAMFRETAERCPDRSAVVADDRELTYAELDRRADHLAAQLAARGVRSGDRVGICLDKSAAAIIGVHGVLKAGAAYVPIAADQPSARAAYIIRDAGIAVVLTDGSAVRALAGPDRPAELVVDATCPLPDVIDPPAVSNAADDIAYVLYTSGSTGTPKGVLLSHCNALSFVDWAVRRFGLRPEDRMSNHAPLNFDLSVLDLFGAARAGAAVVVVPRSVAAFPASVVEFITAQRISVWYSVPTALVQMSVRGGLSAAALPSLRLVLFAGEVFPVPRLRQVMAELPHAEFHNLYGPTETNVCTWFPVPRPVPDDWTNLPIGYAIDGVEVFARDDEGAPVPDGELGELWVRGPTVMRGYLGDPERTARVLVEMSPGDGDLVYRTGDLASVDADGRWWFAGRRDKQTKSRGYRIELGEIEARLGEHPAVVECAVVATPDDEAGNRIDAHAVCAGPASERELVAHCRDRLPRYMVPWSVTLLPELPRTTNGKINYQALGAGKDGRDARR